MKYVPPIGADADAPYVDGNPTAGIKGSPVPAAAIEQPMREIMAVITGAGLTPDEERLDQLKAAIAKMITDALRSDWTQHHGGTGWQRLPSGLILQWGTCPHSNNYVQTFPLAFPTALYALVGAEFTHGLPGFAAASLLSFGQRSLTGFVFGAWRSDTGAFVTVEMCQWIAIGK